MPISLLTVPTTVCNVGHMPSDATPYDEDPQGYLTPAEVAGLLKISRERVYRLCSSGALRSISLGENTRRIRRSDLEAFIEGQAA